MREGRKKTTTVTASLKNGFLVQFFLDNFSSINFFFQFFWQWLIT